jgi:hypothetical protein
MYNKRTSRSAFERSGYANEKIWENVENFPFENNPVAV